jgi:hypothetical protein
VPVAVSMPASVTFSKLASGQNQTCGIPSTGTIYYCWGLNSTPLVTAIVPMAIAPLLPSRCLLASHLPTLI